MDCLQHNYSNSLEPFAQKEPCVQDNHIIQQTNVFQSSLTSDPLSGILFYCGEKNDLLNLSLVDKFFNRSVTQFFVRDLYQSFFDAKNIIEKSLTIKLKTISSDKKNLLIAKNSELFKENLNELNDKFIHIILKANTLKELKLSFKEAITAPSQQIGLLLDANEIKKLNDLNEKVKLISVFTEIRDQALIYNKIDEARNKIESGCTRMGYLHLGIQATALFFKGKEEEGLALLNEIPNNETGVSEKSRVLMEICLRLSKKKEFEKEELLAITIPDEKTRDFVLRGYKPEEQKKFSIVSSIMSLFHLRKI